MRCGATGARRKANNRGARRAKTRHGHDRAQRNGFRNVYLDAVEPLEEERDGEDEHADEVAWKTAVDSAPWLVGSEREVPAEELFEKLQPFKELVVEDIKDGERED